MSVRVVHAVAIAVLLAGCSTNIKPPNETIQPPKVPLGQYKSIEIKPLKVAHMEGDSGDKAAVQRIEAELKSCLAASFNPRSDNNGHLLVVEPAIPDLKKINGAERFFLGAMAGSSAVLLNVKFSDGGTSEVIADPTFYAKAAAMGGAFSFGATDNAMLSRIVNSACDYTRKNM